jgi:HK97 family phage portal protein
VNILQRLDARLNRAAMEHLKSGIGYPNPGWAPLRGWVVASSTGVVVDEENANTVAAWFAGVRKISQDVAKAPLHVYRREGRMTTKVEDDPLYWLLHDAPNPEMTSMVFRETLQAHAIAWGNGYAEKELDRAGRTIALWPLLPDRMEPRWEQNRRVYYYTPRDASKPIRVTSDRIFHLPGIGFDGLVGYPILRLARETLAAAINLRDYGNRVVNNDARPGTVLTHPSTLSETARKNIKDSWDEANRRDGPGRTALLEEGLVLTTLGFPPEDVQFLESQQWQVSEVARWLDIAPHKIGDLTHATFSNIEEQNIDHTVSTLGAWFVRWEQQLNKDVVPRPLFCEHNLDAALRGKTLERAQANVLKINAGAMVPNEWRDQDNQNPLPWGDERVNTPNNTASNGATVPPATPGGPA